MQHQDRRQVEGPTGPRNRPARDTSRPHGSRPVLVRRPQVSARPASDHAFWCGDVCHAQNPQTNVPVGGSAGDWGDSAATPDEDESRHIVYRHHREAVAALLAADAAAEAASTAAVAATAAASLSPPWGGRCPTDCRCCCRDCVNRSCSCDYSSIGSSRCFCRPLRQFGLPVLYSLLGKALSH